MLTQASGFFFLLFTEAIRMCLVMQYPDSQSESSILPEREQSERNRFLSPAPLPRMSSQVLSKFYSTAGGDQSTPSLTCVKDAAGRRIGPDDLRVFRVGRCGGRFCSSRVPRDAQRRLALNVAEMAAVCLEDGRRKHALSCRV